MQLVKVSGNSKDFSYLCKQLEDFQYNLIPVLKENNYTLTDDLQEITGYVLYVDNNPVGSIGLKKISNNVCGIVRVFVAESYRGNGYANLLMEKIEELAKELGYKKAEIIAWCESKAAINLYKKFSYSFSEEKVSEWYGGHKYVELHKDL